MDDSIDAASAQARMSIGGRPKKARGVRHWMRWGGDRREADASGVHLIGKIEDTMYPGGLGSEN
jgi:hypothetical protein